MTSRSRHLLRASFLAVTLTATTAHADDKSRAEALFEEGLRLYDAKDYRAACDKLAESQKLDPASGTLLALGRCYESAGRTASAHDTYADAIIQAHADHDAPREKLARDKEAALAPNVPHVVITLPADASDMRVERDGVLLSAAALAGPIPIDPGAHEIVASMARRKAFLVRVSIKPGETKKVQIPRLSEDAGGGSSSGEGLGTQRTLAIAAGATGAIALGVGAYFGLQARSFKSDSSAHCLNRVCDAEGVSLVDSAGSSADAATALFVAGGVLGTAAVVLWLTAPSSSSTTLAIGPTGGALRVRF